MLSLKRSFRFAEGLRLCHGTWSKNLFSYANSRVEIIRFHNTSSNYRKIATSAASSQQQETVTDEEHIDDLRVPITVITGFLGFGKSTGSQPHPRVYGYVIGIQFGRTVEILNSFELQYDHDLDSIHRPFLELKQEQYRKVFPTYDMLGWYSTGSDIQNNDMQIHKALMDINESPIYVLLNPAINRAKKDLPVKIFESELHVIDGVPSMIFVRSAYMIETLEAERISEDVAHINLRMEARSPLNWLHI